MHNHLKDLRMYKRLHNYNIIVICKIYVMILFIAFAIYTSTQSWSKMQCVLVLTLTISSIGSQNVTHVAVARIASYYILAVVTAAMSRPCTLVYI